MSFNLNKGDEPVKKTHFDLSKPGTISSDEPQKKSSAWMYFLIAFVVICGFAWYFTLHKSTDNIQAVNKTETTVIKTDSTSPVQKVSEKQLTPVKDTVAITKASVSASPSAENMTTPTLAAYFRSGSVIPQTIAKSALIRIRKRIKNAPATKINVFGYASSEGELAVNQRISQARADAYKKHLIENGIAETSIVAQGKGIENPIASNDTESGRQKNRRVEVALQ